MKKFFSIILCFALCFCLCSCGGEDSKKSEHKVDIEYYANLGQIPECEFSLGANTQVIKDKMEQQLEVVESGDHSHGEFAYTFIEGEETALIDCGVYRYYYYKNSEGKGVTFIASFEDAYGFIIGESISKVKDVLSDYKYTSEALNYDNSFFLNGSPEGVSLSVKFGKNTVSFIFVENALTATVLFDNSEW